MVPYSLYSKTTPNQPQSPRHLQPAFCHRVHYIVHVLHQAVWILIQIQKVQVTSSQCQLLVIDSYAPDSLLAIMKPC